MPEPRVAIIGGGPAGLSAAIAAARLGVDVTLLEAGARVGGKILATGNGRCNLSNLSISSAAYNHPEFVAPVLGAFPCEGVRTFFGDLGLLTYADDGERVYPTTNVASSVLDVLRLECADLGVTERVGFEAWLVSCLPHAGGFEIRSRSGDCVQADAMVVATGGDDELLAALGHAGMERVPVLGPLTTETGPIRGLSGIRVRCAATLLAAREDANDGVVLATERGELLFRDYGVSGIMIFDLSRYLQEDCVLSVDFFPDVDAGDLRAMLAARRDDMSSRMAETFLAGMVHSRLAHAVLRAAHIDPNTPVSDLPYQRLAERLKDFRLTVTGRGDASQSQVTRGGAAVEGFDPETMESRQVEGLFAAGEALDIDGRCGGFNLHWAWASGIVAGQGAALVAARRSAGDAT